MCAPAYRAVICKHACMSINHPLTHLRPTSICRPFPVDVSVWFGSSYKPRLATDKKSILILCIVLCLLGGERLPQGGKGSGGRGEPGVARRLGGNIASISWRTLMASVMLCYLTLGMIPHCTLQPSIGSDLGRQVIASSLQPTRLMIPTCKCKLRRKDFRVFFCT